MLEKKCNLSSYPSSESQTRIPSTSIAERIRALRGDEKQGDFAKRINCNVNTLRSYEKGLANPNFEFIQTICQHTDILTEWLIFGFGPMRPGEPPQPAEPTPQQPVNTLETADCARCAKLEAKIDALETERREMGMELREVNAENRRMAKENRELSVDNGVLREQIRKLSGKSLAVDCA